ncbi:MAG: ferredoxin [Actinobacteria bacterium]|nr:ferredoxin [Actinomycetota bacterium]
MRVRVDEDSCQGQQMCSIAAPEVFGSDELGHATVLIAGDIPEHLHATRVRPMRAPTTPSRSPCESFRRCSGCATTWLMNSSVGCAACSRWVSPTPSCGWRIATRSSTSSAKSWQTARRTRARTTSSPTS